MTELPKTASNKIMRRELRDSWMQNGQTQIRDQDSMMSAKL